MPDTSQNRPYRVVPPKQPPRASSAGGSSLQDQFNSLLPKTGYIDAVDDPNNPKYCSILVNNELPAVTGFPIPANFGMKLLEAPYPPSAPPTGTLYFNNRTHHTGGSEVTVDVKGRTFTPLTGFSTSAPVDYSAWFKNIKHNGATDPQYGFLNPSPIDITQVVGMPTSVNTNGPQFASGYSYAVPITAFGPPSGTYDAKFTVGLDLLAPVYLKEVRFYAVAKAWNGSAWVSQGWHPSSIGASPKHVSAPSANGVYVVIIDGLNAGTPYDIYATYVDLKGIESAGALLVTTTAANPLIVGHGYQASGATGLTPNAGVSSLISAAPYNGAPRSFGIGNSQCDITIPFFTDIIGTTSTTYIAEIQLVTAPTGTTTWSKRGEVAIVAPDGSNNGQYTTGASLGLWSGCPASSANASAIDFGIRYVDYDGKFSNVYVLWSNYTVPNFKLGQSSFPTMPSGTKCSVTLTRAIAATDYTGVGGAQFQLSIPPFNLSILQSNGTADPTWASWFGGWRILAMQVPNGSSVDATKTDPTIYVDLKDVATPTYSNPLGATIPLGSSDQAFQLAAQVLDQAGNPTLAAPFAVTTAQQISAPQTIAGAGAGNMIVDAPMQSGVSWNHASLPGQSYACSTTGSPYWKYSTLDGTIAAVIQTGDNTTTLSGCNAFVSRASSPRTTAANSSPMQVSAGSPYIAGATVDMSFAGGGSGGFATIQIIAAADVNNYATPTIYQTVTINGNSPKKDYFTPVWTPTAAASVIVRLMYTNLGGFGSICAPRFAQTTAQIAFAPGPANTAQQDHSTMSDATRSTITTTSYNGNAGSVNPTALNPAYGNAPHGAMPVTVQDVVKNNGGTGQLNVGAPGGVIGQLPNPNNSTQVLSVVSTSSQVDGTFVVPNAIRRGAIKGGTGYSTANLLFNARFANSGNGWTVASAVGASVTFGTGTAQIVATNVNQYEIVSQSLTIGASVPITASGRIQIFTLSSSSTFTIDLVAWSGLNGSGTYLGTVAGTSVTTTGDFVATGTTPAGTQSVQFRFYFNYSGATNNGNAWLQDPQLEFGSTASPFSDDLTSSTTAFGFGPIADSNGSFFLPSQISAKHLYGAGTTDTGALIDTSGKFLLTRHDQTIQNRNGFSSVVKGQAPYVTAGNVLTFPAQVTFARSNADGSSVAAGQTISLSGASASTGIFMLWASGTNGSTFLVIPRTATGAVGTGFTATLQSPLYELIGTVTTATTPYSFYLTGGGSSSSLSAAAYDVLGSNGDGTGTYHAGKARGGTNLPHVNHSTGVTNALSSSGDLTGPVDIPGLVLMQGGSYRGCYQLNMGAASYGWAATPVASQAMTQGQWHTFECSMATASGTGANSGYGPMLVDSNGNGFLLEAVSGQISLLTRNSGSWVSVASAAINAQDQRWHRFTLKIAFVGGTSVRCVGFVDGSKVVDYTTTIFGSSLGVPAPGFYNDTAGIAYVRPKWNFSHSGETPMMSSTPLNQQNSMPPLQTPGASITAANASGVCSVTISWSAGAISYPDGYSLPTTAGSFTDNSLAAATTYHYSMYADTNGTVHVLGNYGANTAPSATQKYQVFLDGRAAITEDIYVATPSTSGGAPTGGGGGGGSTCPSVDQLVLTKERGPIRAGEYVAGMHVMGPHGKWVQILSVEHATSEIIAVTVGGETLEVDVNHYWQDAGGAFVRVTNLSLNTLLAGADGNVYAVDKIEKIGVKQYAKTRVDGGVFVIGQLIGHNIITF